MTTAAPPRPAQTADHSGIIRPRQQLLIGGSWTDGSREETFDVRSPTNGELLAICAAASPDDVDRAVASAESAAENWAALSPHDRAALMHTLADRLEAEMDRFAMIEALNVGKPLQQARLGDVAGTVDHFRYFASAVRTRTGEADQLDERTLSLVLSEPVGVVGAVIAWNFPLSLASWKLGPALAAGCTVVIKPSSYTPLSLLEFGRLAQGVLPAGVLNIVTGPGSSTGQALLDHPRIAKLAITGSTETGYEVAKAAAEKLIPATLELGGKSANIVLADCDWDRAVENAATAILWNAGQVCESGSRLLVQASIHDRFVEALVARFQATRIGLPWKDDTEMGPLANEAQLEKFLRYVDLGRSEGAVLRTGGERLHGAPFDDGFFVSPAIFTEVRNDMQIAQEEVFGPFLTVERIRDADEAIAIANASDYGLAGAVWTRDLAKALHVARGVRTGRMWVNTYHQTPAHAPFGGYKKSGYGRETHLSAIDAYSEKKNIFIDLTPPGRAMSTPH